MAEKTAGRKRSKKRPYSKAAARQMRSISKALTEILYHAREPMVRRAAAWTLYQVMWEESVPILIKAAEKERDLGVRKGIFLGLHYILGYSQDARIRERILSFLASSPEEKTAARDRG